MSSKKVLVVGQHYWPENFRINDITDYFIERGCSVDVLCGIPNYPSGKFTEGYSFFKNRRQTHKGVNIHRALEIPRGNNSSFRIFVNYVSFPFFSLFYVPRLLFKSYDQIFIYQTSPVLMALTGLVIGRIKRIETTIYVLDLWPENLFSVLSVKNNGLRKLVTIVSHWHYKKADKLAVLTTAMQKKLLAVTGKNSAQVSVIPQTSEKLYEKDVHDKNLALKFQGGFNILFAGNISPAQSFETILSAALILQKKNYSDIRWVIVGDGMSRKWLEDEAAAKGLSSYFYFEGQKPIEDIPRYNSIADVMVGCLAKSDLLEATVPAKVMSYIASGKPMVLAMDGEVQELINSTIGCGFVGPTEDFEVLANNIERVYKMKVGERKVLGERAKKYHFKHFERNLVLNKLYNFLFS